jgi:hypothetical protein
MRRRGAAVLSSVAVLALAGAPAALAGSKGHWTQITDGTAANIDQVTLARTPDGVLHAAWSRPSPSNPGGGRDLLDLPISPSGGAGAPVVLATNWATIANPFLVPTGGFGLDLFAGAMRSTNFNETVANLALFSSSNGGQSWSLDPTDLTNTGAAYSSNVAAALGAGGTPFETWGSSSCLCVHTGTSESTGNSDFQQGLGDFGYEPGMAFDPATGQLVVAWYSNGTGHDGIYAAQVNQQTGGLAGPQLPMPGTGNLLDGPFGGRTPIVARAGGGLYIAYEAGYPAHTKVLLWRVGSGSSLVLAQNPAEVRSVGIASTPSGRLWVFWSASNGSGSPIVYARRSNPQATAWGATVAVKPPPGATTSWNLVGNGQADALDLVGSFSLGTSSAAASWHTQVLSGLAVKASLTQLKAHAKHAQHVTFHVSDAGAPVVGATVRVGSVAGKTKGNGTVKLALGPFTHKGTIECRASLNGYSAATLTLRVK